MTKPELIAELGRRIRRIEHPDLTDEEAINLERRVINDSRGGFPENLRVWNVLLPITLPRVLAALPDGYKLTNFKATNLAGGYWVQICDRWGEDDEICCWLLTKIGLKSSSDATADDQSEETLAALIELFPEA